MNSIDWNKAPEWATILLGPQNGLGLIVFAESFRDGARYKSMDGACGRLMLAGGHNWTLVAERPVAECREAPTAWDGTGLPPVGTVCEVLFDSVPETYVPIVVLAHDESGAVYRFTGGHREGEYQSEKQDQDGGLPTFRPIRTPEQIAAEEREKGIAAIYAVLNNMSRGLDEYAAILWDMGYRKVEGGDV